MYGYLQKTLRNERRQWKTISSCYRTLFWTAETFRMDSRLEMKEKNFSAKRMSEMDTLPLSRPPKSQYSRIGLTRAMLLPSKLENPVQEQHVVDSTRYCGLTLPVRHGKRGRTCFPKFSHLKNYMQSIPAETSILL